MIKVRKSVLLIKILASTSATISQAWPTWRAIGRRLMARKCRLLGSVRSRGNIELRLICRRCRIEERRLKCWPAPWVSPGWVRGTSRGKALCRAKLEWTIRISSFWSTKRIYWRLWRRLLRVTQSWKVSKKSAISWPLKSLTTIGWWYFWTRLLSSMFIPNWTSRKSKSSWLPSHPKCTRMPWCLTYLNYSTHFAKFWRKTQRPRSIKLWLTQWAS